MERIQEVAAARPDELSCTTDGLTVTLKWTAGGDGHTGLVVTFVCSDFYAFASDHSGADVVVSCAFLDLVPLDTAIPAMVCTVVCLRRSSSRNGWHALFVVSPLC